jgi:SRSO17 transposase
VFVLTNEDKAAADARIGAQRALRERSALMGLVRSCFARTQTWVQAVKYLDALVSGLPSRNGWTMAEQAGDRSPARMQRLLNRALWDEAAAMSQVRRYAAAGLDAAARRSRRRRMTVGALDETGQEKQGSATAGVKRQYMGCAGRVANGISTVHLSYVREKTGHALAGARQWIPAEDIRDPVKSLVTGLPLDLRFRTKGQLAIDILTDAYGDGLCFDFVCGVYGACTALREFLEGRGRAYVLRVASNFALALAVGTTLTCAEAARKLLKRKKDWEVRSAGTGSKGERWYAWAWLATASRQHSLLVRRHLKTGELAFHYCFVPEGQLASKARLIKAAGLRWPVGGELRAGKGLLRPGPVPGPALHRDSPPHRAGHGRFRGLRRHRRGAQGPHRQPGPATRRPRCRATGRPRAHPAHRPRDPQAARRRPRPPGTTRPCCPMAPLATPPPGPIPLVPQTCTHAAQLRPGQLAIGCCRTRRRNLQVRTTAYRRNGALAQHADRCQLTHSVSTPCTSPPCEIAPCRIFARLRSRQA